MSLISGKSSTIEARNASVTGRRWIGGVPRIFSSRYYVCRWYRFAEAGQFRRIVVRYALSAGLRALTGGETGVGHFSGTNPAHPRSGPNQGCHGFAVGVFQPAPSAPNL